MPEPQAIQIPEVAIRNAMAHIRPRINPIRVEAIHAPEQIRQEMSGWVEYIEENTSPPKKKKTVEKEAKDLPGMPVPEYTVFDESEGYFIARCKKTGMSRYGTFAEYLDYCKKSGRVAWDRPPRIEEMSSQNMATLKEMEWEIDGVGYTETKCAHCKMRIHDHPAAKWLYSVTRGCASCATQGRRKFVNSLLSEPVSSNAKSFDTYGVESECNPTISLIMRAREHGWGVKPDGSLRGLSAELVSPILPASAFESSVESVFKGQKAKLYSRCGLHIWLGSGWMDYSDLGKLARYCAMHESSIARLCSPSRSPGEKDASGRPMRLSRAMMSAPLDEEGILNLFYGTTKFDQRHPDTGKVINRLKMSKRCNDKPDDYHGWLDTNYPGGVLCRYQWINFHGHFNRGAIEIRLHQGSVNPETIICWGLAWKAIMREVASMKPSQIERTPVLDLLPGYLSSYYKDKIIQYDKMRPKDEPTEVRDFGAKELLE